MERINSLKNPRIKQILQLSKARERLRLGLIAMEGAREIGLALDAGYLIDTLYICPEIYAKSEYPDLIHRFSSQKIIEIAPFVFDKLAYREGSDGLIALIHPKNHSLNSIKLSPNPFIIVLEAVEKPGNLGAVLRTADAGKVDAVIICDPLTDIYNPNAIRSSIGCIFTVPIGVCASMEALQWMKTNNIKSFAAELKASDWYHECNFKVPSAIIMGTEADGLTDFWLNNADSRIKIPMRGKIDSLNVSVSTAILTFEAMRQRGF
jgi:TrmH family RNA methyltransferase